MPRFVPEKFDSVTANLMLMVALFMGLMCFFIVLNQFSSANHDKMLAARQSLDRAFGFSNARYMVVEPTGDAPALAQFGEINVSASLRSVLPDIGFETFEGANGLVMQVDVPMQSWQSRLRPLRYRLIDLMTRENAKGRYVLHMTALNGQAGSRYVLSMASRLEKEGVRVQDIVVGYVDLGRDVVQLQFVPRPMEGE